MSRKKDYIIIGAILIVALVLFLVSQVLPRKSVEDYTADVTLAPDAITVVEETAVPVETGSPVPAEETMAPAQEPSAMETSSEETEGTEVPAEEPAVTAEPSEEPALESAGDPAAAESEETSSPAESVETSPEPVAAGPVFGPVLKMEEEPVRGYVVIRVMGRQYGDPIPMDREKIITIRQDENTINQIRITRDTVYMEHSTCENQDCVNEGEITLENYKTRILSTYIICLPNSVEVEMVPVEEAEP